MKKVVSVVVLSVFVMVLATACAGKAPAALAGKWEVAFIETMGQTFTKEDLAAKGSDVDVTLDFINSKNVQVAYGAAGIELKEKATYTLEGENLTISTKGSDIINFVGVLDEELIRLELPGMALLLARV